MNRGGREVSQAEVDAYGVHLNRVFFAAGLSGLVLCLVCCVYVVRVSEAFIAGARAKTSADLRVAVGTERIAEATERARRDRVYFCKALPPISQPNWGAWIETSGNCVDGRAP